VKRIPLILSLVLSGLLTIGIVYQATVIEWQRAVIALTWSDLMDCKRGILYPDR